jgi:hypothetical protein
MAGRKKNAEENGQNQPVEAIQPSYVVIVPFQDHRDYMTTVIPNQYAVGDDVSHMDADRLSLLVDRGLAEFRPGTPEQAPEADPEASVDPETDAE